MAFAYTVEASGRPYWGEPPTSTMRRSIQVQLRRLGRYGGPTDGAWGPQTIRGIQRSIAAGGYYSGPIDGAVGVNTCNGVSRYAGYTNGVDFRSTSGGWDSIIWRAFLSRLSAVPTPPALPS